MSEDGANEIARRSRGTPRIAGRLLRRVRDFAIVEGAGPSPARSPTRRCALLDVDPIGLDQMDRKYLTTIAVYFGGGPVGIETIAAALSEPRDAIEEIIEPYLIQKGFVQRTPRGRVLTPHAFRHLGCPSRAARRRSSGCSTGTGMSDAISRDGASASRRLRQDGAHAAGAHPRLLRGHGFRRRPHLSAELSALPGARPDRFPGVDVASSALHASGGATDLRGPPDDHRLPAAGRLDDILAVAMTIDYEAGADGRRPGTSSDPARRRGARAAAQSYGHASRGRRSRARCPARIPGWASAAHVPGRGAAELMRRRTLTLTGALKGAYRMAREPGSPPRALIFDRFRGERAGYARADLRTR